MTFRALVAWGLVVACIGAILTFSGDDFSARSTWRFFSEWIRWLWPEVSPAELRGANRWLRKGAHLVEYAALGLLTCRAVWLTFEATWQRTLLLPLGLVLAVAAVDEAHQALTLTRTGSPWDVALDLVGGAVGLAVILGLRRGARVTA